MARPRPVFRARRSTPVGFGYAAVRSARLRPPKGREDFVFKRLGLPYSQKHNGCGSRIAGALPPG